MNRERGDRVRVGVSPAVLLPLGAGLLLYALGSLVGSGWLVLLAAATFGAPAAAQVVRPRIGDLVVQVRGPALTCVGSTAELELRVRNGGRRASDPVRISLHGGHDPLGFDVPGLSPGDEATASATVPVSERGVAQERAALLAFGPFGMSMVRRELVTRPDVACAASLVPVTVPVTSAAADRDAGGVVRRTGVDVTGVREWRPGDSAQHVHWRSTARRGRLVLVERGDAVAGPVFVLAVGAGPGAEWETVMSMATSALLAANASGRATTVFCCDTRGLVRAPLGDRAATLRWSAVASASPVLPAADIVSAVAQGVAEVCADLVVVATPRLPSSWWAMLDAVCARASLRVVRLVAR